MWIKKFINYFYFQTNATNLEIHLKNRYNYMKTTNRPRIQSINGNIDNLNAHQCWNEEYFPREQYSNMWQQLGMKKSTESFSECHPEQLEVLVSYYKKENEDIRCKNDELVQMARLLKEKQSFLLQEIAILQVHYRKLQKSLKKQSTKQPFKQLQRENMMISAIRKQDSPKTTQKIVSIQILSQNKESQTALPLLNPKQALMKTLNKEFTQIVEESIKERDPAKRKMLRKELAQLASEMKKVRSGDLKQDNLNNRKQEKQRQDTSKKALKSFLKGPSLKIIEKPSKI